MEETKPVKVASTGTHELTGLKSAALSYVKESLQGETPVYKAVGELALPLELLLVMLFLFLHTPLLYRQLKKAIPMTI